METDRGYGHGMRGSEPPFGILGVVICIWTYSVKVLFLTDSPFSSVVERATRIDAMVRSVVQSSQWAFFFSFPSYVFRGFGMHHGPC